MASVQEIILVFTKYPVPGQSKTRLIPALGAEGAADLQRWMTRSLLSTIDDYTQEKLTTTEIYHTGGCEASMRSWLGVKRIYKQQSEGDLGQKMFAAISDHLSDKRSILLIGSDCPAVSSSHLFAAFAALRRHDIVLGPAHDGGYYLIGAGKTVTAEILAPVFTNIPWGDDGVLKRTLEKAADLNLSWHLLPKLHDIDTPDDLKYLRHHPDA